MKTLLILALMLFSFQGLTQEKKIYKYTDENGVIHYSEKKVDDKYKEADDLPGLSVVPAEATKPIVKPKKEQDETDSQPIDDVASSNFEGFRITSPVNKENVWGTGGKLTATVNLSASQKQRYLVQFVLDGVKQKAVAKATQTINEVYRGEHSLVAHLVDKRTKGKVSESQKITFFMHQHTKK